MSGTDSDVDGERADDQPDRSGSTGLPTLPADRRTVMGALAAGVGLSAVGGASAQEDGEDEQDDDGTDGEDGTAEEPAVLSAALSASEHGVFSEAHGSFHVAETEDGSWAYLLHLEDVECVTQAHVHEGDSCESGPVVLPLALYTETPAGDSEGAGENLRHAGMDSPIAETGTVEPGGEAGLDEELATDIVENPSDYYVNVHTTHHPGGELRGQLRGVGGAAAPDDGAGEDGGGGTGDGTDDGMDGGMDDGMDGDGTDDGDGSDGGGEAGDDST